MFEPTDEEQLSILGQKEFNIVSRMMVTHSTSEHDRLLHELYITQDLMNELEIKMRLKDGRT